MTDHDREIVETLAREVMGWSPVKSRPQAGVFVDYGYTTRLVHQRRTGAFVEGWNPLTDWRAAGEVLEALRAPIPDRETAWQRWDRFITAVVEAIACGVWEYNPDAVWDLLKMLSPRLISEAAVGAVRGQEG